MTICFLLGSAFLALGVTPPSDELIRQLRVHDEEMSRVADRLPSHLNRGAAEREAAQLRAEARQILSLTDTRRHSLVLRNAADRLASLGHPDLSRLLLSDLAAESASPLEAGEAWRMLAMLSVRIGDTGAAEAEIGHSIDILTLSADSPTQRVRLRSAEALLLRLLREAGRHSETVAVLQDALERDRVDLSARQVAQAQASIARAMASAGDDVGARAMWAVALSQESPLRDRAPQELLLDVEAVIRGRDPAFLGESDVNALIQLWDDPRWSHRAISLYAGHHLINALFALGLENDAYETGLDLCARADQLLRNRQELDALRSASMLEVITGIVETEHFRLATTSTTVCDIHDRVEHAREFLRRYPRSINRQWVADSLTRLRSAQ